MSFANFERPILVRPFSFKFSNEKVSGKNGSALAVSDTKAQSRFSPSNQTQ